MSDLKNIEQPVVKELMQFQAEFAASLRSAVPYLQQATDVILQKNGKHIRPLLVFLTAKTCGNINDETVNSAVFLELLHTATLIHDDVIDETKQRRGAPSLNAIFDNRVAVLVGDYVLSTALLRSIMAGNLRIVNIISTIGRELSEGELKQLEVAEEIILDEAVYMEVIRKKTASLLAACTEIGAISANASDEFSRISREIGENLGYCFQIKDDIFDYFTESNIGKPTGNDIREGKVTLPLLYALRTGRREEAEKACQMLIQRDFSPENIQFLLDWAKASGGIEYARERMQAYHAKAIELILQLPDNEGRASLLQLADYIISRTK
ncbi:octaprenyl-diphosphate synthase [Parabacteroides sp. PFB2-12]|uniref:polyprenyl synthetase family protein n=1 Tax=unclassified Parabacteroides TaxID=2649774 RepID=UPI002476A7E4|nr:MULTISPECIES: polyprenyl synthetase family protein [unclassified Parabacteroides]MDH6342975.1 octaprenyl-diphosphate synthase [Parabacteroides sp. PM6-13]MDH6391010.1 octaprenyl-diphosphate synthase [Parabacteroides sp. PFB2-12]